MSSYDVAIVGAGAAGLAAAGALRRAGRSVVLLEAADRLGGRARTSMPEALGGEWIDEGGAWLHSVKTNPLVPLARAAGEPLSPAFRHARWLFVDGHRATERDEAEYEDAQAAWEKAVEGHLAGPDISLAEASGRLRKTNPWVPTIESWEASLIGAVDATRFSLRDWHLNTLPDGDLLPSHGLGRLLLTLLAGDAGPVTLGARVARIDWSGREVVVGLADGGSLTAGQVIVTVSTGVLAAGGIRFEPALPPETEEAITGLPMGLLSKLAMRAPEIATLGIAVPILAYRRRESTSAPFMTFNCRPRGTDHVIGFFGGDTAWSVAPDADEAEALFRAEWRAIFGSEGDRVFQAGRFATDWGTDPLHRGAYSYARPGASGARAALAAPVGEGRLLFAGEACRTDGLAGTVGGAVLDGWRAAALAGAEEQAL